MGKRHRIKTLTERMGRNTHGLNRRQRSIKENKIEDLGMGDKNSTKSIATYHLEVYDTLEDMVKDMGGSYNLDLPEEDAKKIWKESHVAEVFEEKPSDSEMKSVVKGTTYKSCFMMQDGPTDDESSFWVIVCTNVPELVKKHVYVEAL